MKKGWFKKGICKRCGKEFEKETRFQKLCLLCNKNTNGKNTRVKGKRFSRFDRKVERINKEKK